MHDMDIFVRFRYDRILRQVVTMVTTLIRKKSKYSMASNSDHIQEDLLLEKAIRGEREGLECLVNVYKDLAYTIALKIVLNREDAEEVVQDAFMKAFAALGSFRKASRFSTWLYRIVYNTALTKVAVRRISTQAITDQVTEAQPFEEVKGEWDRKKYVDMAISRLKEDERIAITLHYIAEMSVAEIGRILNLKRSAVKMRLLRGRKQIEAVLRVLLKEEIKDLL